MVQAAAKSGSRPRQTKASEPQVMTPQNFMRELEELFAQANRKVAKSQLYVMTLLAAEDENGPAISHVSDIAGVEDVARSVGRYVQTAMMSKDASDLPTERMLKGINWLTQPLSPGQLSFLARHTEWMEGNSIAKPSTIAGYQRVYTRHANEFGIGDNNSCDICIMQREVNEQDTAAKKARADQLSAQFRQQVKISL